MLYVCYQDGAAAAGGPVGGEADFMKMFSGMGLDGGDGGGGEEGFMPMMQNMMKTLLSRDVLYPSLTEISEKVNLELCCFFFLTLVFN